ncbi:hypothetical protein ACIGHN_11925 [Acidovorax sp. NPDC077693]|uniref:hypothetical protein n=1 Tax=unclassified Acidovorax TaxID=2684926 RepID=UPI0037C8B344
MTLLSGCSGPSREELARIKSECASFHKQERAKYSTYVVKPIDHWTKDGRIVVELSEKESEESTKYTSHLCVYDKDKGSISLPSVFERARWSK